MVAAPRLELGIGGYEPPRLPLPHATIMRPKTQPIYSIQREALFSYGISLKVNQPRIRLFTYLLSCLATGERLELSSFARRNQNPVCLPFHHPASTRISIRFFTLKGVYMKSSNSQPGALSSTRTKDLTVNGRLLCQLS